MDFEVATMVKVGSREFKNRLGRYLRAVRQGKTLIVTDRGKPVAKVSPPDDASSSALTLDEVFERAEAQGLIRRGRKPLRKFKAVPSTGKPASEMIIEDRQR
jgi:prevent-host-death family protein